MRTGERLSSTIAERGARWKATHSKAMVPTTNVVFIPMQLLRDLPVFDGHKTRYVLARDFLMVRNLGFAQFKRVALP